MRTAIAAAVVASSLVACGGDRAPSRTVSTRDAGKLLIDRNWLDTWPKSKHDHLQVYRFVPSMGGGVYQDRTVFKGTFEMFMYEPKGDQLTFVFPHTGEHVKAHYAIERVAGPKPFDLKLTIHPDPRGPGIYYGMTSDKGQDVQALVKAAGGPASD